MERVDRNNSLKHKKTNNMTTKTVLSELVLSGVEVAEVPVLSGVEVNKRLLALASINLVSACLSGWQVLSSPIRGDRRGAFILCTIFFALTTHNSFAQNVGINATGATPHNSSIIDLNTGNTFTSPNGKGILPPNVALTSITDAVTITSPATSLWVYNTATAGTGTAAVVPGYYYWDGAKWVRLQTTASSAPDWSLLGNAGTTAGTNFIGTTDAIDWVIKTNNIERMRVLSGGNVGIGTTTPSRVFEVRNPALNPQLQIGTTSLLSNRGSILYGRSALWEVGSDISVNNSDNFFIAQASSGQYALAIDNNRNVGIGTTTPTVKLDVAGNIQAQSNPLQSSILSVDGGVELFRDPTSLTPSTSGYVDLKMVYGEDFRNRLYYNNVTNSFGIVTSTNGLPSGATERLTILNSNGNVGIGTTAPINKLHIAAVAPGTGSTFQGGTSLLRLEGTTASFSEPGITFAEQTNAPICQIAGHNVNLGAGHMIFSTRNIGALALSEKMRILDNGNVGIGTTAPSAPLHVIGANAFPQLKISNTGTGSGIYGSFLSMDGTASTGGKDWFMFSTSGSASEGTGKLIFKNQTDGNYGITMISSGNVGIGTTAPNARLTIGSALAGTALSSNLVTNAGVLGTAATNELALASIGFTSGNSSSLGIRAYRTGGGTDWTTTAIGLGMDVDNSVRAGASLWLHANSNVGIGTASPTALLSVNGAANNTTGVWAIFSDARVKTVDADFTDGLEIIKKIHPVKFHYNANAPFNSDKQQIGIVAQDLEKIAPYMVDKIAYKDIKDLREVNSQAYIFLLINAVKEQQKMIEEIQKQNDVQQKRIEKLEQK